MARDGNRGDETGIAIADLLRMPAVRTNATAADQRAAERAYITMSDMAPAERVNHVLDDRSVQALFDALPVEQWVSKQVAAAYCQCSVLTLERRMAARWNTAEQGWRGVLQKVRPAAYRPKGFFRWGFVRWMQREYEERPARRRGPPPKMDPLVAALARRYRFLVEADKKTVVAGWGQAHLTVDRIIAILDAGGGVLLLSAVDALARPWSDAAARVPWHRGMREALMGIQRRIDEGASATSALALAETVGEAKPGVRRRGL